MKTSIDDATPEEWDAIVQAHHAGVVAQSDDKSDHLMRRLNAALEKPFGEVPIYWRCLAFALWQQGHPVLAQTDEFDPIRCVPGWVNCTNPQWSEARRYRILAKPEELVLPSIEWVHVGPRLKWLAQDASGLMVLFEHKPAPSTHSAAWASSYMTGHMTHADNFASAKPGKGDWTKLIVQRPEGA